jgi:sec-independent protein translocase protein TatA|tara:strand:- start:190 stop:459 length:270 start_codon:yes stop_codon:yes gene_type:complete
MNVFGVGLPEMAVIAVIALLVFGPKKLPELGRSLGKTLKGFQAASTEFEQEFRKAVDSVELPAGQTDAAASQDASTPADDASDASGRPG